MLLTSKPTTGTMRAENTAMGPLGFIAILVVMFLVAGFKGVLITLGLAVVVAVLVSGK
jgi:hypothetical protein